MANDPDFVQYICDQFDDACDVSYRHMFGGTTLYSKGKVVALICDNQLFVKPTEAGRSYIGDPTEAPAYEGSKEIGVRLPFDRPAAGFSLATRREDPRAVESPGEPAPRRWRGLTPFSVAVIAGQFVYDSLYV